MTKVPHRHYCDIEWITIENKNVHINTKKNNRTDMGQSQSTNVMKNTTDIMSDAVTNIVANQYAKGGQSQIMDVENVEGDVNISGSVQSQNITISMDGVAKQMSNIQTQQNITQALSQAAAASTSGISLFNASNADNEMDNYMTVSMKIAANLSQICGAGSGQDQKIVVKNVTHDVNLRNNTQEQTSAVVAKCIQDATAINKSLQTVEQDISQSAVAKTVGIDPAWIMLMAFLILLAPFIGAAIFGASVGVYFIGLACMIGGGVLIWLWSQQKTEYDMYGIGFSTLIKNDLQCDMSPYLPVNAPILETVNMSAVSSASQPGSSSSTFGVSSSASAGVSSNTFGVSSSASAGVSSSASVVTSGTNVSELNRIAKACTNDDKCCAIDWDTSTSPPSVTYYTSDKYDFKPCPNVTTQKLADQHKSFAEKPQLFISDLGVDVKPQITSGQPNDVFINTSDGTFYWKQKKDTDYDWIPMENIDKKVTPPFHDVTFPGWVSGISVYKGTSTPAKTLGSNNDLFINTDNPIYWEIMKKVNGNWVALKSDDVGPSGGTKLTSSYAEDQTAAFPGFRAHIPRSEDYNWSGFKVKKPRDNLFLYLGISLIGFGFILTLIILGRRSYQNKQDQLRQQQMRYNQEIELARIGKQAGQYVNPDRFANQYQGQMSQSTPSGTPPGTFAKLPQKTQ